MYKSKKLDHIEKKVEDLEKKLETKNVEVEHLQQQLKEMKVQFAEIERVVSSQKNQEVASLKSEMRTEMKKELDKVLPTAVEQGLRDLPFEMVCSYRHDFSTSNSIISYDRITLEFNNADRPGGADGSMSIETGVFTTVTSGYYIITYSANAKLLAGEHTEMFLYHNGVALEESLFEAIMENSGDDFSFDPGSRTVVSIVSL